MEKDDEWGKRPQGPRKHTALAIGKQRAPPAPVLLDVVPIDDEIDQQYIQLESFIKTIGGKECKHSPAKGECPPIKALLDMQRIVNVAHVFGGEQVHPKTAKNRENFLKAMKEFEKLLKTAKKKVKAKRKNKTSSTGEVELLLEEVLKMHKAIYEEYLKKDMLGLENKKTAKKKNDSGKEKKQGKTEKTEKMEKKEKKGKKPPLNQLREFYGKFDDDKEEERSDEEPALRKKRSPRKKKSSPE